MRYKGFAIAGLSAALAVSLFVVTRMARADNFAQENIAISFVDFSPCTGELILFSGNLHLVEHVTFDKAGGVHVGIHENYNDVSGVGLTSGTVYHATGVYNDNYTFGNGVYTETSNEQVKYIASGGGNNFKFNFLFHITAHPDGTITSFVDTFSIACQ